MGERLVERALHWIELAVAVVLTLTAVLGVALLAAGLVTAGLEFSVAALDRLLGNVLVVFILIELLQIALAYLAGRNVLPNVFEAGLVAVIRGIVVLEAAEADLPKAAALSLLVLALGVTWFLLRRSGLQLPSTHEEGSA